jgi:hypothetical protein
MTEGNIVTSIPRNVYAPLFKMMHGGADSRVKLFKSPVQICANDIIDLNRRVANKLNLHHLEAIVETVKIGYVGDKFDTFSTWENFLNATWETTERVEEVFLRWDFALNFAHSDAPQNHSLVVRVSANFKAANFFQYLSSSHKEDIEDVDIETAPGFCRVDYMNAQISKELLNEVTEWFAARKQPKLIPDFWYTCKKYRSGIARFFHHWIFLSQALLLVGGLFFLKDIALFQTDVLIYTAAYLIFSMYYISWPSGRVAQFLGSYIFERLSNIEGSRVVFDFTQGDKKHSSERFQENQRKGKISLCIIVGQIFINLISSYAFLLMTKG